MKESRELLKGRRQREFASIPNFEINEDDQGMVEEEKELSFNGSSPNKFRSASPEKRRRGQKGASRNEKIARILEDEKMMNYLFTSFSNLISDLHTNLEFTGES